MGQIMRKIMATIMGMNPPRVTPMIVGTTTGTAIDPHAARERRL